MFYDALVALGVRLEANAFSVGEALWIERLVAAPNAIVGTENSS